MGILIIIGETLLATLSAQFHYLQMVCNNEKKYKMLKKQTTLLIILYVM